MCKLISLYVMDTVFFLYFSVLFVHVMLVQLRATYLLDNNNYFHYYYQ